MYDHSIPIYLQLYNFQAKSWLSDNASICICDITVEKKEDEPSFKELRSVHSQSN